MIIKRIRVEYRLTGCPEDKREAAERAHSLHATRCPVAKTLSGCVDISTTLSFA